ncbi:MAG: hypothetical protein LAP61_24975 [Acidobacteriia bacterium]|nr:hypothetical protein [Terriglobia bacterium]
MPGNNPSNHATRLKPGHAVGANTRWQKGGPSPCPGGKTKLQRQFEEGLVQAFVGPDPIATAEWLAGLLRTACEKSEPWAVQLAFARMAPQTLDVRLSRGEDEPQQDFSVLSDEELATYERLLKRTIGAVEATEGGAGQALLT